MKKSLFIFGIIFLMNSVVVNAKSIKLSDIPNNSYVIGNHIFTEETILTTKHIMLGATTIESDKLSDMIIYYKGPRGNWIDGLSGEEIEVPVSFEIEKKDLKIVLDDVKITGKEYNGRTVNNEVSYKIKTDKEVGDGVEISSSDTIDGEYEPLITLVGYDFRIDVEDNTRKYFRIRPYYQDEIYGRIYGDYSEPILIDQTNMEESIEITNIEYEKTNDIVTLTINDKIGDGFTIYSSDTKDGEYAIERSEEDWRYFQDNKISFDLRNAASGNTKYFKIRAYKDIDTTRIFSKLSDAYGILLQSVGIESIKFDGSAENGNEVVYNIKTDKEVGDGVEIYSSDTANGIYTLINTTTGYEFIRVDVIDNTKKYFKIRPYQEVLSDKLYGGYSEPIEIDQTNIGKNIEIDKEKCNVSEEDGTTITLAIKEQVGDGFIIYSSDTEDDGYAFEYSYNYNDSEFSDNTVTFVLANAATGNTKYFKVKAYDDKENGIRSFSKLSDACELQLPSNNL